MTNILLIGATGDRSLVFCRAVVLWLMTQQLVSDIDIVEESELRRLEGAPPSGGALLCVGGRAAGRCAAVRRWAAVRRRYVSDWRYVSG